MDYFPFPRRSGVTLGILSGSHLLFLLLNVYRHFLWPVVWMSVNCIITYLYYYYKRVRIIVLIFTFYHRLCMYMYYSRNQHDQFHAQLEKAENGFSIVAEYFGRGLFSTPPTLQPINQVQNILVGISSCLLPLLY